MNQQLEQIELLLNDAFDGEEIRLDQDEISKSIADILNKQNIDFVKVEVSDFEDDILYDDSTVSFSIYITFDDLVAEYVVAGDVGSVNQVGEGAHSSLYAESMLLANFEFSEAEAI